MVKHKNFKTIAVFLYELVCRWGAIKVLVTDNAPQYLQAAELLAEKFHIKSRHTILVHKVLLNDSTMMSGRP